MLFGLGEEESKANLPINPSAHGALVVLTTHNGPGVKGGYFTNSTTRSSINFKLHVLHKVGNQVRS